MRVIIQNESRCEKDLDRDWDIKNIDEVRGKLAEIPLNEFEEGETFNIIFSQFWCEYVPAGIFKRVVSDEEDVSEFEYLGLEFI
ncbi:hypothetical protein AB4033_000308 [Listeria monocytogenes]|nr:hypothetical protein [Listeria monocytogenes]EAE9246485.1 hypothetical protein [Listeria monocytogenes]EIJ8085465.1 hypothetical protein [Listeria monocytogenes]EKZ0313554.1 hypothetical protein [Listeria monocytogenes]